MFLSKVTNSGLSVLLKDTWTRAGIEPPTPRLKDGPADLWHKVNRIIIMKYTTPITVII